MAWMTAAQALETLKVRSQTLYANVSRGRIRAKPDPKDPRRSLYNSQDVKRMATRGAGRRTDATVASQAIGWGDPILSSSISTVIDGRLCYRGVDAAELSASASLEQTAHLLWDTAESPWRPPAPIAVPKLGSPLADALAVLAGRAVADHPSIGRARPVLIKEGKGLVQDIATAMLERSGSNAAPLHRRLATAWRAPRAEDLIRRALVLLADHELNASTFALRVAISTGAPLAAGLIAGLATLSGPLHGGASTGVLSLIAATRQSSAAEAVRAWLAQGNQLPAFGHPLYPGGDVRAAALLDGFTPRQPFIELRAAAEDATGELPNIDFAICALADRFRLPAAAPFVIFAVARSVGWIAHALEQATSGQLIRPRARYTGPPLRATDSGVSSAGATRRRPSRKAPA
jgi:citrate synthase